MCHKKTLIFKRSWVQFSSIDVACFCCWSGMWLFFWVAAGLGRNVSQCITLTKQGWLKKRKSKYPPADLGSEPQFFFMWPDLWNCFQLWAVAPADPLFQCFRTAKWRVVWLRKGLQWYKTLLALCPFSTQTSSSTNTALAITHLCIHTITCRSNPEFRHDG